MISAGVIGWPVAHSKSPLIHRFWLGALGVDGDYGRFAVHPDRLGDAICALPALGLRGVNVTVPHKVAVIAHLDRLDAVAARVGAVNTVVDTGGALVGHNTDVAGVITALATMPAAARVVLLGMGGAARAALAALRQFDPAHVTIAARDTARASALLGEFGFAGDAVPLASAAGPVASAGVVINATTLGMLGEAAMPDNLLLAVAGSPQQPTVFDMVYAPLKTPLLAAARAGGMTGIDGLTMLIGQAAAAFTLFYGAAPPRERDAELRALLTA